MLPKLSYNAWQQLLPKHRALPKQSSRFFDELPMNSPVWSNSFNGVPLTRQGFDRAIDEMRQYEQSRSTSLERERERLREMLYHMDTANIYPDETLYRYLSSELNRVERNIQVERYNRPVQFPLPRRRRDDF